MSANTDIPHTNEPSASYNKKLTYADYLKFDFDYMVELIKGQLHKMTPAPNSYHQQISAQLTYEFVNYFRTNPCSFFHAPFDVILPIANEQKQTATTVVQPDLCVICDQNKIEETGCFGPPDLIIEILSTSTQKKDLNDKYSIYEQTGVNEYWTIYPQEKMLHIHQLKEGHYLRPTIFNENDIVYPFLFPELGINLANIFIKQKKH